MEELKTPLSIRTRHGYGIALVIDRDGVGVCEGTLSDMKQIVAAVNRDAENAETVRRLTEQQVDKLISACSYAWGVLEKNIKDSVAGAVSSRSMNAIALRMVVVALHRCGEQQATEYLASAGRA